MPRVLVVEDQEMLRKSMVRAIGKMPLYSAHGVVTVAEAVTAIKLNVPDILVSDIDLPDRSGIELLTVLKKEKVDIPVIFVSAYLNDYSGNIPISAGIELLEKPFELEVLRSKIKKCLKDKEIRWSESGGELTAAMYVELACIGKHSVRLCTIDTNVCGEIVIRDGELWSAQDWEGKGADAFFRLVRAKDVSCVLYEDDSLSRNIHGDSLALIHLATVQASSKEPSLAENEKLELSEQVVTSLSSKDIELGFKTEWNAGVEALLSKDYLKAEQKFSRALLLKPEDPGALANLKRLREIGGSHE